MKQLAVIFLSLIMFAGCAEKTETERSAPPAKQDSVRQKAATTAIDTVSLNREMEKLTLLQQELENLQQELNDKERQLNDLENTIEAREAQLDQREAELDDRETSLSRLRVFSFIILFLGIVLSAIALVIMTRQQEKQKSAADKPKEQGPTKTTPEKETPIADPATSAAGEEKTEPLQKKKASPRKTSSTRAKQDKTESAEAKEKKTPRRRSTASTQKTTTRPRKKKSSSDSETKSQDDKKE